MIKKKRNALTKTKSSEVSIKDYVSVLQNIKKHIQKSQIKAALAVNKELIKLYWFIGKTIVEKQKNSGWGSSVIERLAKDLQSLFPGVGGFSRANVFRMGAFYASYEKVAQSARQIKSLPVFNIPWFHNVVIVQKIKDNQERLWYAQKVIDNGWSRSQF